MQNKKNVLFVFSIMFFLWGLYGILSALEEVRASEIIAYTALVGSMVLLLNYKRFNPFLLWFTSLIAFSLIYHTFGIKKNNKEFDGLTSQYFDSIYFSVVTGTTVGYGDIVPKSHRARALTTIQIFVSFLCLYDFIAYTHLKT